MSLLSEDMGPECKSYRYLKSTPSPLARRPLTLGLIGGHQLLCSDCRNLDAVKRLTAKSGFSDDDLAGGNSAAIRPLLVVTLGIDCCDLKI